MCRAIYPHELSDPDFNWLIDSFRESHPDYLIVEMSSLPVVFLVDQRPGPKSVGVPVPPQPATEETDESDKAL